MVIVKSNGTTSPQQEAAPPSKETPSLLLNNVAGDNPLKLDPELVALLRALPSIKKYKYFQRWKQSFLNRLLPQIQAQQQRGMAVADEASDNMDQVIAKTAKQAHKVVTLYDCHQQENSNNNNNNNNGRRASSSVKGTLALRELGNLLQQTNAALKEWIPSSSQDEKRQGYTKFHLGAALIRQGFPHYIKLKSMQDCLNQIIATLQDNITNVVDDQLVPLVQSYQTQVTRFCDVMADLGMYEIMKKCWEFAVAPDEEESSDEENMNITIEGETLHNGQQKYHSIDVEVEPNEAIASVMETIAQEFGIPLSEQVIRCKNNSKQDNLQDQKNKTLGKAGITDGAILQVGLRKIPLVVHVYGRNDNDKGIPVQVDCRHAVLDIHKMVEPASGIPMSRQRLFRNHKKDELTGSNKTVQDLGFADQEHLYLEPKSITLCIQIPDLDNQSFDVELGLDDTTETIQAKIAKQTGMESRQFSTMLPKTANELQPQKTIRDLKLQNRDVLTVHLNKIPIAIKRKADGTTVVGELMVHPTKDTLATIKGMIKDASGVEPAQQILYHGSSLLEKDPQTVLDMGLKPQSTLFLDLGPAKVTSSGEIYCSFTVKINEAPNEREYKELAKVTKNFYAKLLKKKYCSTFQNMEVKCHKTLFEASIPSDKFNVYVEWDFTAFFDASASLISVGADAPSSGHDIPTRHELCSYLVKADLSPYLTKVGKMSNKSFSKTCGLYTEQTDAR